MMTIRELEILPSGTRVEWRREFADHIEEESGFVVARPGVPRHIQWVGGQTTDGSDDWALAHIRKA
jgi:hypothetical protein